MTVDINDKFEFTINGIPVLITAYNGIKGFVTLLIDGKTIVVKRDELFLAYEE